MFYGFNHLLCHALSKPVPELITDQLALSLVPPPSFLSIFDLSDSNVRSIFDCSITKIRNNFTDGKEELER